MKGFRLTSQCDLWGGALSPDDRYRKIVLTGLSLNSTSVLFLMLVRAERFVMLENPSAGKPGLTGDLKRSPWHGPVACLAGTRHGTISLDESKPNQQGHLLKLEPMRLHAYFSVLILTTKFTFHGTLQHPF